MAIITEKNTNSIIGIGKVLEFWDNGYPVILDKYGNRNAYVADETVLHELVSIPEHIEPYKYCYTPELGFYENPNYEEPVSEESVTEQEVVDSILQEVSEYEY